MPHKLKIFLSYSHKDESIKDELYAHLAGLRRSEKIELWEDRQLLPGTEWDSEIKRELINADIILLLVSADFINSTYVWEKELKIALDRHEKKQMRIVPIIIRPCDWQDMPFAHLQCLPRDALPITSHGIRDEAYTQIAKSLRLLIDQVYSN